MFDDIFGGIFDFNGDGHTDFAEEAVGFAKGEIINRKKKAKAQLSQFSLVLLKSNMMKKWLFPAVY